MQANLGPGMWAVGSADGVRLGVLHGEAATGWTSTSALLVTRVLPSLVRRLNEDGVWTDGQTAVAVADGAARIDLADGIAMTLGVEATARLQILCRLVAEDALPADHHPVLHADVQAAAASLVTDPLHITADLARDATASPAPNAVVMHLQTDDGPLDVRLPSLAVLVAAMEAHRDHQPVVVTVRRTDRTSQRVVLGSGALLRCAADAQWLLPALARPVDTQA